MGDLFPVRSRLLRAPVSALGCIPSIVTRLPFCWNTYFFSFSAVAKEDKDCVGARGTLHFGDLLHHRHLRGQSRRKYERVDRLDEAHEAPRGTGHRISLFCSRDA